MKINGLRWYLLSLVALVIMINILDRGTMNYMWLDETDKVSGQVIRQGISSELGFIDQALSPEERQNKNKEVLAMFNIIFMVAYGASNLISGKIYDRIGTRNGFSLSTAFWGGAIALTAFIRGLKSFAFLRAMLGLGEAGPFPGCAKVNAEWFPVKERATAQGICNAASAIGNILVPVIIPLLFIEFGWRNTFLVLGAICFVWIIPWLIINRGSPEIHPWITMKERDYIITGRTTTDKNEVKTLSIRDLLCDRRSYSVILSRFFIDPVWWMFMTWLPIYLHEVYHLNLMSIVSVAWIPFSGAALGGVAGGWVSGKLISRGYNDIKARKVTITIGGLLMVPGMIGAAFAPSAMVAAFMLVFILGGFAVAITNIQTLPGDFHSGKTVGSLAGLGGLSAIIGVILSTFLVPLLTRNGNWLPFFSMGLILAIGSVLSVIIVLRPKDQIEKKNEGVN